MVDGFFSKFFKKEKSKDSAKKRLKLALIYDQLEISDETLAQLQNDIVEVLSRYFEIDKESLTLDIRRSEESSSLILNTPILSARHRQYVR